MQKPMHQSMKKEVVAEEIEFKDETKEREDEANNPPFHAHESAIFANHDLNRYHYPSDRRSRSAVPQLVRPAGAAPKQTVKVIARSTT